MKNPNHIAIIMDGNGRWGKKNFNNKIKGHQEGIRRVKPIVERCISLKIKNLSLYALSYDNLKKRDKKEIKNLLNLLKIFLKKNSKYFEKKKILINFMGEKKNLPHETKNLIENTNNKFKIKKPSITLNIAFNYSSKQELINTVKQINKKNTKVNEINMNKHLYTSNSGNPDMIIRTGGYSRLSDFMLWQAAYSELFFLEKLWPDFEVKDFNNVIKKFLKIKRNFGS